MNINEPWEAQLDWAPDFPRGSYVFDGFGKEIAGPVGMDEATLIAAAPDLLDIVSAFADWYDGFDGDTTDLAFVADKARAAIAKAKGA